MQITETQRLIRAWEVEDAPAFARIHQDPKLIEFLRGLVTLADSDNRTSREQGELR